MVDPVDANSANTLSTNLSHQTEQTGGDSFAFHSWESSASNSSFSLLLVSGLCNVPRSAKESEPVSSDTTTQIQFSTRSIIPSLPGDVYPVGVMLCCREGAK